LSGVGLFLSTVTSSTRNANKTRERGGRNDCMLYLAS